jgi:type I restriction enzyme, S subunit
MKDVRMTSGLQKGRRRVPLGEVGEWYGGSTPSKANASFWTDGTIPWISPKDMKRFRIARSQDLVSATALENATL